MHVAITGSTGLVGEALTDHLRSRGHTVTRLVRGAPHGEDEARWDPLGGAVDTGSLAPLDGVVHLAGEPIGQRWTPRTRQRILASRTTGTHNLATAMTRVDDPPEVFVSASAIGIYGADHGDAWLDEKSPLGDDFLAKVCAGWEQATTPARDAGIRVVNLRSGLVQSPHGDPLSRMLPLFKMGLGGRLGDGEAWWSWITLTDIVRAYTFALEHDDVEGPVNATAPNPVTNATFTKTLGKALRRPTVLPAPRFGLRLVFGEMADVAILASQRVSSERLRAHGFTFEHEHLEQGLRAELDRPAAGA